MNESAILLDILMRNALQTLTPVRRACVERVYATLLFPAFAGLLEVCGRNLYGTKIPIARSSVENAVKSLSLSSEANIDESCLSESEKEGQKTLLRFCMDSIKRDLLRNLTRSGLLVED